MFAQEENTRNDNTGGRAIRLFDYAHTMKFKLIGRDIKSQSKRYDYMCPWLKNRYNCAHNKTKEYGQNAFDWKLVLDPDRPEKKERNRQSRSNSTFSSYCNLWDFVHDFGGPSGLGQIKKTQNNNNDNSKNIHRRTYNVLLFGNSFLRQLFEGLVCSYGDQITDSLSQLFQTAVMSLRSMEERKGKPYEIEELGQMTKNLFSSSLSSEAADSSSHGVIGNHTQKTPLNHCDEFTERRRKFYDEDLPTIPRNCKDYTDDIAMVEFGNTIRFYYMFRPYHMANLTQIFDEMWNLDPKDVDVFIYNNNADETLISDDENRENILDAFRKSGVWERRILWPFYFFQSIQERDCPRWFGADNPWITDIPDTHPCMPGMPDDEINLMLYLIYMNSTPGTSQE